MESWILNLFCWWGIEMRLLRVFCSAFSSGTIAQGQAVGKCDSILVWGRNKTSSSARMSSLVQMIMKEIISLLTWNPVPNQPSRSAAHSGVPISSIWWFNCYSSSKMASLGSHRASAGKNDQERMKVPNSAAICRASSSPAAWTAGSPVTHWHPSLFHAQGTGRMGTHTLESQCPQSWAGRLCNDSILQVVLKHCTGDRDSTVQHCLVCIILWITLAERKCYLMKSWYHCMSNYTSKTLWVLALE